MKINIAGDRKHFESLVQEAVAAWIGETGLDQYGSIWRIDIDPESHNSRVDVMLHGEREVVTIEVDEYVFHLWDGEATLEMRKVSSTRKWVEKAVKELVEGKQFVVPDGPVKYLPLVL